MLRRDWAGRLVLVLALVLVMALVGLGKVQASAGVGQIQQVQVGQDVPAVDVTPDALALFAGAGLSLVFSLVPGLNTKFAALLAEYKRGIMLVLLLLTAGIIYGLGCGQLLTTNIPCTQAGVVRLAYLFIEAAMANQTTYAITPLPQAVKEAGKG